MDDELREQEKKIAEVAGEITRYLQRSEGNVAETLDGILNWWIPQQRILEERRVVEAAIERLCATGILETRVTLDGGVLYTASAGRNKQIKDE